MTTGIHDLSATIGKCGKFQITIAVITKIVCFLSVWGMLFMAFGLLNPGWTCQDKEIVNNSYSSNNTLLPTALLSKDYSSHSTTEWSMDCKVREECKDIIFNPDSTTVVSQWNLTCDLAWVPSFMISIEMVGVLVGSYSAGSIGEKFGRRVSLFGHLALHSISHLFAIFSVSWEMHLVLLFFVGCGAGGILTVEYPYGLEFMSPYWRGVFTALPVWNIGSTTFGIVIWIAKDWRYVHGVTVVLGCVAFLTVFWAPESVRWLTVSGKVDEAKRTVIKIARMNGRPTPATNIIDDIALEERHNRGEKRYTYLDMFKIRSIRGYSIKFALIWIIMAITYYMISFGIKSLSGNFYLNFLIFSVFELPAMGTVAPAVNRLGRRPAVIIYYFIAMSCAFSVGVVSLVASGDTKDMAILMLILVCKGCIVASWASVSILSSELYPTVVRSLHFGFLNGICRIGVIIAPYLIPNDPKRIFLPYLIIGVLLLVNCVLIYLMPETKGTVLPDIVIKKSNEEDAVPVNQG